MFLVILKKPPFLISHGTHLSLPSISFLKIFLVLPLLRIGLSAKASILNDRRYLKKIPLSEDNEVNLRKPCDAKQ